MASGEEVADWMERGLLIADSKEVSGVWDDRARAIEGERLQAVRVWSMRVHMEMLSGMLGSARLRVRIIDDWVTHYGCDSLRHCEKSCVWMLIEQWVTRLRQANQNAGYQAAVEDFSDD